MQLRNEELAEEEIIYYSLVLMRKLGGEICQDKCWDRNQY